MLHKRLVFKPSFPQFSGGNPFISFLCIIFFFLFSFLYCEFSLAGTKTVVKGARFPTLSFQNTLSGKEQAYLGVSRKKFTASNIQGTLFILEVFSTYCTSCPKNVPILNKVYSRIEKDADLKGKVKVIGIAAGNIKKRSRLSVRNIKFYTPY